MNGHGWVTPNPDGAKARCGGPGICRICALEKVQADVAAASKAAGRAVRCKGSCPMGCGHTLFLADGGYVTCSYVHCPCPDAVSSILEDADPRHVVVLGDTAFTVRHPLRERLGDELERCPLHEYLAALDGPPYQPGRYWVTGQPGNLTWEPAPQPEALRG